MRRYTLFLSLFAASPAFAADLTVAQLISNSKVLEHDSVIVETAKAHEADMCRGFSLTESQIKDFFKRSAVVDEATLKTAYQWAPCIVQGHILYQDQKFLFVVNAASTGRIETAPGKYLFFGCNVCKDLFDYGYVVPPAPVTAATPASSTTPPR
jgi:hypothetical protein